MAVGPGKYDDLCTLVRKEAKAQSVILIVMDGDKGTGFSCQADLETLYKLPELLEDMARQIRRDGPFA